MSARIFSRFLCSATMLMAGFGAFAQTQPGAFGGYSPYTIYGIGDLHNGGTAYSMSMGNAGVAMRDVRYINILNPASVTARDSLSFMADISLYSNSKIMSEGGKNSGKTIANIGNLTMSFPLTSHSAMMVGLAPFSSTGYSYSTDGVTDNPSIIVGANGVGYNSVGQGGLYQLFAAAGVSLFNGKLSLGAQGTEYFGTIEKSTALLFGNNAYSIVSSVTNMNIWGLGGKFGLQYEQSLGKSKIGVGATYRTSSNLRGNISDYSYVLGISQSDTLYNNSYDLDASSKLSIADEFSVGVSLMYNDKFKAEVDYSRSGVNGWDKSGFDSFHGVAVSGVHTFSASSSQSVRAGVEYTPNRNDIRYYYRRMSYRGGLYWNQEYYKLDDHSVHSYGITLGATLPVFRWYNGITFTMDLGRRSVAVANPLNETYLGFSVGFNLFDIWFQKPRYE